MLKNSKNKINNMKLAIYESAAQGDITERERASLLYLLEEKEAESKEDLFGDLVKAYPDFEDEIEKLQKKIEKESDDSDKDDDDEKSVEESANEILDDLLSSIEW